MKRAAGNILILCIVTAMLMLAFSRCAKVVAPAGGPRDTIPPELVSAEPPNYSVNFESDEVEIEFNEFIQFNELQQQFLSSPPFEEDPEIVMKGKGLQIEFNEPLRDSTTYTLNFGNAITDFREGNPFRNFKYVFSTGPELDSMEVQGNVVGALNLRPREEILVMLYEELEDSIPYKQIPDYVSRTNEDGSFTVTNIRLDTFKIFALGDQNANYIYDNIQEPIAFRDSFITFGKQMIEEHDTIYKEKYLDTLNIEDPREIADTLNIPDSVLIDTIIHRKYMGYPAREVSLHLFNEPPKDQYLRTTQRQIPSKVDFVFNKPVEDSIEVQLLDTSGLENWYIKERSPRQDTITYWIKDSAIYNRQYLGFAIGYTGTDSVYNEVWTTDTVEIGYAFQEDERTAVDSAQLSSNLGNQFDLNRNVKLRYPYPVESIDTGKITLYKTIKDSIVGEKKFQVRKDTQDLNTFWLDVNWDSETSYTLRILPQTVKTIYNVYHDTLEVSFNTQAEDHYGSLIYGLSGIEGDFILQLLSASGSEENVLREKYNENMKKGIIRFDYLDPGDYRLKLIYDRNGNKKWDTGNYLQHRQPERVIYHPETFNVRSNWEYEIDWNVVNTKVLIREKKEE